MEKTTYFDLYGGDLKGIIQKLPYLKELGVTGIYLNLFGNEDTMKELVEKAHSLKMKVMMDGVFNHCGTEFLPWKDVLEHGEHSRYKDWFMIQQFPVEKGKRNTKDGSYYSFAFAGGMPKLTRDGKSRQVDIRVDNLRKNARFRQASRPQTLANTGFFLGRH